MTWHNSTHSTSSQEPEAAFSLISYLDTIQSERAKSCPIHVTCCSQDSETASFQASLYGTTWQPSTEIPGADQLTFFAEDSHAKTSQHKEQTTEPRRELMEIAQAFGVNMRDSLMKCGLDLSLPKTPRTSELKDLLPCSKTLPAWGMMLDGVSLELATLARIITERESGYLPTVLATDWKGGCTAIRKDRGTQRLDQWRDYVKIKHGMTYPHPTHSELRMGWPQNWTDLRPLVTDKFRSVQQWHSTFSQKD